MKFVHHIEPWARMKDIATGIMIFVIGCAVVVFVMGQFGYTLFYVNGESMEPTIQNGSLILIREVEADDQLHVGDVVLFPYGPDGRELPVFHRLIAEESGGFRTKGDNPALPHEFDLVPREDIQVQYEMKLFGPAIGMRFQAAKILVVQLIIQLMRHYVLSITFAIVAIIVFVLFKGDGDHSEKEKEAVHAQQ